MMEGEKEGGRRIKKGRRTGGGRVKWVMCFKALA